MEGVKTTIKEQERIALPRTTTGEPLLIRRLLQHKKEFTEDFVQHFLTHTVRKVYLSGQTSGTFIGNMLTPCMERLLQVETGVRNPASFLKHFQFNINQQYSPGEMLTLCPARSRTTIGPIRMAQECRRLDILVVCITIDSNSLLANLSDTIISRLCGSEESFIKTRTHMASLLTTFLCIIETANQKEPVSRQQYAYYQ